MSQSVKKVQSSRTIDVAGLQDVAHKLRVHSVQMTEASNSGHPTSCASISELMSVLFFDQSGMHYDAVNPKNFTSDRLVLSKGHAAPILYAAWCEAGYIKPEELLNLRKFDCQLEGHPTPLLPYVDVATGSLGQGLGAAAGMAYASKYLDKLDNNYWVILGDGETAEGSVWEAANFASYYKLNNLVAIVDVNRLGQSQNTSLDHHVEIYEARFKAFGFNTIVVDGHNIEEIVAAFTQARDTTGQPTAIVAKTFKGKYFPEIEDKDNFHGKPIVGEKAKSVIAHLEGLMVDKNRKLQNTLPNVQNWPSKEVQKLSLGTLNYKIGEKVATRNAYGDALKRLGASDNNKVLVALDGDTKNSTFAITYQKAFPEQFVECFIAEQNMVSIAQGLAARGKTPFASTFAAFFTRAFDQIRMGGISRTNINLVGSHSGVSIGEDGPSQMALEELSMVRAMADSIVFYPSDAVSTERAVELLANIHSGTKYIRTSRPGLAVLYGNDETFAVGQSKTVFQSEADQLVIVSAGVILHEALAAAKALKETGVNIRVVDLFSIKPVDVDGLVKAAAASKNLVLTVEEDYMNGGIYDVVCGALSKTGAKVHQVAVDSVPRSGKPAELLDFYGLSAAKIQEKVKSLLA